MRKRVIGREFTHEKERWGEFTIRKINGMRVPHEKESDGVRVHHEKERWGESST